MTPEDRIDQAIRRGESHGIGALDPAESVVFAISEAEVYCAVDGIDTLIERYGQNRMALFADAFASVGAIQISGLLRTISDSSGNPAELHLNDVNRLINERHGYSYESILSFIDTAT